MRMLERAAGLLRAPRTALALLSFQAIYAASAVSLPIRFSSPLFLVSVALLFFSTLVCTFDRTRSTYGLWRGTVNGGHSLPIRDGADVRAFLQEQGFNGDGRTLFRFRFALWGGWVLHVGVLALILGIFVQQAFHDGGAFELTEGERTRLSEPGAVFGREAGTMASKNPPEVEVTLLAFDPYYHQTGYAADRASRIMVGDAEFFVDRAKGVSASGVTIYQAIPTSLSVNVQIPSMGIRSIHLRREAERRASADIKDLAGNCGRLVATTQRPIDDVAGTGPIVVRLDRQGSSITLKKGDPFDFGGEQATLVAISRWGGFTYSRSPGVPLVFAGFSLVLLGSALLVFPAGTAQIADDGGAAALIRMKRGAGVVAEDWVAWRPAQAASRAASGKLRVLQECEE